MSQEPPPIYHRSSPSFSQLQPRSKAAATTSGTSRITGNSSGVSARASQAASSKDSHHATRPSLLSSGATTASSPNPSEGTAAVGDASRPEQWDDKIADKVAVESFVKSVLCPSTQNKGPESDSSTSIHDILPPLTSSNEVDFELYALLAIVVHLYLDSWYKRITPDTEFVREIIQTVAHCTRGLEQRVRQLNWESLMLDELPRLLDAHLEARCTALAATGATHSTGVDTVYHTLRPHPALDPAPQPNESSEAREERAQNDQSFRMLVSQGLLAILLPTEDLQNPCLFALVSEILADLVLGEFISRRFCDSVFIYNSIVKACASAQEKLHSKMWLAEPTSPGAPATPQTRLERFGLLSLDESPGKHYDSTANSWRNAIFEPFWAIIHYIAIGVLVIRACFAALSASASLPQRPNLPYHSISNHSQKSGIERKNTPVLCMHVWATIGDLVGARARMPWFHGFVSLIRHFLINGPGRLGDTNGRLDRLLSYHLTSPLRDPDFLPLVLRTVRLSLYPDFPAFPEQATSSSSGGGGSKVQAHASSPSPNAPTPAIARTSAAGLAAKQLDPIELARHHAATSILNTLPRSVAERYFNVPGAGASASDGEGNGESEAVESMTKQVECLLTRVIGGPAVNANETTERRDDHGQDGYTTRHLVYTVLELLVARAVPELRGRESRSGGTYGAPSLTELLAERGVSVSGAQDT